MRFYRSLVLLIVLTFAGAASAADERDRDDCKQSSDRDRQIAGCTRVLLEPAGSNEDRALAYSNRGDAYRAKREYDRALPDYNDAIKLHPKLAVAYKGRGHTHRAKYDYDRAIADYNQAIKLDPTSSAAYSGRGIVYYEKRDYDRAIADLSEAIRLDPKDANAWSTRGDAYRAKGDFDRANADYDRAIAEYGEAIKIDPKSAAAYFGRGSTYLDKKDNDRAIADLSEAISLDPTNGNALGNRGIAYAKEGDFDRAIADYTAALKIRDHPIDFANRGVAYANKGDFDRAIADYNAALKARPHPLDFTNRGLAYYNKKDYDRAIADFDRAIKLDPNSSLARATRVEALQAKQASAPPAAAGQNRVQGDGFSVVLPAGWSVRRTSGKTIFLTGPGGMPPLTLIPATAAYFEELDMMGPPPRNVIRLSTGSSMRWEHKNRSDGSQLFAEVRTPGGGLLLSSDYSQSPFDPGPVVAVMRQIAESYRQ